MGKNIEELIIQLKSQNFFEPFHGVTSQAFYQSIGLNDEDRETILSLREKLSREPKLPTHYGTDIYGNGPMVIERYGIPISQAIINAQRTLMVNAIDALMPAEMIHAWIKQYAVSDEKKIAELVTNLNGSRHLKARERCPIFDNGLYKPDELSYKNENRNTFDRALFTYDENKDAKQHPNTPALIIATYLFRGMIVDYLNHFLAIAKKHLTEAELEQLTEMVNNIKEPFSMEDNFIIAAMGITRHNIMRDPNLQPSQITQEDIAHGFEFSVRNGIFRNHLHTNERFACPAKNFIVKMLPNTVIDGGEQKRGQLLFDLFTQVEASPSYRKVFKTYDKPCLNAAPKPEMPQSTLLRQWPYYALGAVCAGVAAVAINKYYKNVH